MSNEFLSTETYLIRTDINELKTNVNSIKTDFSEMKTSVSTSINRMSEALIVLTDLTEKINHNVEEHKTLHNRIDKLTDTNEDLKQAFLKIEKEQMLCQQKQKLETEQEQHSVFTKAKENIALVIIMSIFFLFVFVMLSALPSYLQYLGKQPTTQSKN